VIGNKFIPVGDGNIDLFGNYKTMNFILQSKYRRIGNVTPKDIREFIGTLSNNSCDIGFFVTNDEGGYTKNAKNTAKASKKLLLLCTTDNLVENIKKAYELYSKEEEVIVDINNIETDAIDIFGVKITGGCSIGSITIKNVKTKKFHPYYN
jgi:restriction endonuclease Mrr